MAQRSAPFISRDPVSTLARGADVLSDTSDPRLSAGLVLPQKVRLCSTESSAEYAHILALRKALLPSKGQSRKGSPRGAALSPLFMDSHGIPHAQNSNRHGNSQFTLMRLSDR
jgi:hypothetical protein